jgi:hypothetical protein
MAKEEAKDDGLDKVLSKLDALGSRMDTLETGAGSKNPIKGDADDKKGDAGKKDEDEDEEEKKKREEKEDQAKKDAAEQAKKDAAEAAKKDSGKKDEWPDKDKDKDKDKDDSAKKDATVTVTKKDSDEDEEEKKKEDKRRDAAIADAADRNRRLEKQLADQSAEISRLTALMKPRSDDEHAAFADAQAKADSIFQGFGKQAPRPLEGESLINYRKRLATHLKPYSTVWKSVKFSQLPDEAFGIAEAQVYSDAAVAAANPVDLNDGELREVSRTDPRTGLKTIMFYGRDSFVKSMGRPGRRVSSFRTQSGA